MSGLQGSRWAPKSPAKDDKANNETRQVSVPDFGFRLPAFTPIKPASPKGQAPPGAPPGPRPSVASPAQNTASSQDASAFPLFGAPTKPAALRPSAPIPAAKPVSSAKVMETSTTGPNKATRSQLSRAEIAAAATRARMAEIMGPRRRQELSSATKGKGVATSSKGVQEQVSGGDKEMSEPAYDVEMDLTE